MADRVFTAIDEGLSVAFATPGHPLICEAAALMLLTSAQNRAIAVTIVPGVSVIDIVPAALGQDPCAGAQIIAGADLMRASVADGLSTVTPLMVCSVCPEPRPGQRGSELELFTKYLAERYEPDRVVHAVEAAVGPDGEIESCVYHTTVGTLRDLGDVLRSSRVSYWVEGSVPPLRFPVL